MPAPLPPRAARPSRLLAACEWLLVSLVVGAVSVAATWPLATSPWLAPAHQDPQFSTWRLYQWARNLAGTGPGGIFDGNIFHPARDVLLFSDAIPIPALLSAPFIWAGVSPSLVYTTWVWLAFLTAGLGMYACARELTGHRAGALLAAVIFAAAPSRIEHVMHLELLLTAFMPLAVLGVIRLLRGEARGARLTGVSLAAQFLCCIYYGVFMFTVLPAVVAVEWIRTRPRLPRALVRRAGMWLGAAAMVAGLYALPYQRARAVVGDRDDNEVVQYSATLQHLVVSPPPNLLWGWTGVGYDEPERRLFPGLAASSLAVTAMVAPSSPWTLALVVGGLVSLDASFGVNGYTYPVLRRVAPPYRGLRVPARFGMMVLLFTSLLAAIGCAQVARLPWPGRRARSVVTAMLVAWLGIEYAAVHSVQLLPSTAPPLYRWLGMLPPTVIVHAPLPRVDTLPGVEAEYQVNAQFHRHLLLNGNSGFYPPDYRQLLRRVEDFPDDRSITALRNAGAEYLMVHERHFATPLRYARTVLALEQRRDLTAVMTTRDEAGTVRVYRFLPEPR